MSIIDLVKWDPVEKGLYAWKFPEANLSTFTQLIVAESQEAVLFSKGRLMGKFGPGKHTLNTENLPVLRELFGIPFGGKNPFTAEVWFVNKVMPLTIAWQTDAMRINDPDYKTMVPLRAVGKYGLRVASAEKFLVKLVGTLGRYDEGQLTRHFEGPLVSKTKAVLARAMQEQGLGVNSISVYLDSLSETVASSMRSFWDEYGFELTGLYITSIDIDKAEGGAILQAMNQQSAQTITGHTWQQQKAFDVAEKAVSNQKDSGMMGALLMSGGLLGGSGGGGLARDMMSAPGAPQAPAGAQGQPQTGVVRQVFCSNCSKKFANTAKFCPHCGDPYTPCPQCGADNDGKAVRCVTCGSRLPPKVGAQVLSQACEGCGTVLEPGVKFCPSCGRKAG